MSIVPCWEANYKLNTKSYFMHAGMLNVYWYIAVYCIWSCKTWVMMWLMNDWTTCKDGALEVVTVYASLRCMSNHFSDWEKHVCRL